MANPPRTRHSKPGKQPVTIDLPAGEVSRVDQPAKKEEPRPQEKPAAAGKPQAAAEAEKAQPATASPSPSEQARDEAAAKAATAGTAPGGPGARRPPDEKPEDKTPEGTKPGTGAPADGKAAPPKPEPAKAAQKPPVTPQGPRTPPETGRKGGTGRLLAAGVAGGVVALALGWGLQVSGLLPAAPAGPDARAEAAVEALEAELTGLRASLGELQAERQEGQNLAAELEGRVAAAEERTAQLASGLESLGEGPDAAAGLAALEQRLAALESSVVGLENAEPPENPALETLEAFEGRLEELAAALGAAREATSAAAERAEALEARVDGLNERLEQEASAADAALVVAASGLRSAVERGGSFAAELDTYAALAPNAEGIEALRAHAATGVPTAAQLQARMNDAAAAMIAAARPVDPDAGIVERLRSSALALVTVRPVGAPEGDDTPAIVARMEAALAAGDYEAALSQYATLPEPARQAGRDFAAQIEARDEALTLVESLLRQALGS